MQIPSTVVIYFPNIIVIVFSCIDGNKIYIIKNGYANDSNSNTSQNPLSDISNFEDSRNATPQRFNSTNHTTIQMSNERAGGHWKQMLPGSKSTPPKNESTAIFQDLIFTTFNPPSSTTTYFSGRV